MLKRLYIDNFRCFVNFEAVAAQHHGEGGSHVALIVDNEHFSHYVRPWFSAIRTLFANQRFAFALASGALILVSDG